MAFETAHTASSCPTTRRRSDASICSSCWLSLDVMPATGMPVQSETISATSSPVTARTEPELACSQRLRCMRSSARSFCSRRTRKVLRTHGAFHLRRCGGELRLERVHPLGLHQRLHPHT